MLKKVKYAGAAAIAGVLMLTGCSTDADVASRNLSQAAEMFEVERRVVFFNGITDQYLLTIEGRCSVETDEGALGGSLEVTCKTGEDANGVGSFKKHFLGLSDNVSFFVEQIDAVETDVYHYRVIFKPEVIAPYIDLETSVDVERDG